MSPDEILYDRYIRKISEVKSVNITPRFYTLQEEIKSMSYYKQFKLKWHIVRSGVKYGAIPGLVLGTFLAAPVYRYRKRH